MTIRLLALKAAVFAAAVVIAVAVAAIISIAFAVFVFTTTTTTTTTPTIGTHGGIFFQQLHVYKLVQLRLPFIQYSSNLPKTGYSARISFPGSAEMM